MYAAPKAAKKLSGQRICVTGADGNLYLLAILKAMREFIGEEMRGLICTELRLEKKIEAARTIFPEHKEKLKGSLVKIE
jgi:hypothetical protein